MNPRLLNLTVEVVSSYVVNHHVPKAELGQLLADVNSTLRSLDTGDIHAPAANSNETVHKDYLVCLECGGKYQSLRKHVRMKHGMTPEAYRLKWNLPGTYPMIAERFSKVRSNVAKAAGLGIKGGVERKRWRRFK